MQDEIRERLRYEDVLAVTRDKTLSVEMDHAASCPWADAEKERLARMEGRQAHSMIRRDPPDHTRLRRQVYREFTPKAIKALRPRVERLVEGMLDRLAAMGKVELIGEFALPLPLAVISDLLGMPPGDSARLREWSQAITKGIDPFVTPEESEASIRATDEMNDYLLRVIGEKRRRPADDCCAIPTSSPACAWTRPWTPTP